MSKCGESDGGGGEGGDACAANPLTSSKQRMKVEERMIDLRARQLQSTRSSSRDIGPVSGDHAPSTIEDNIVKLEVRLSTLREEVQGRIACTPNRTLYLSHLASNGVNET